MDPSSHDLQRGRDFEAKVWHSCGKSFSFACPPNSGEFFLLVSFSRCRFRLTEDNVSYCLQVVMGGESESFLVSSLDNFVFCYVVSSKEMGLLIISLRTIVVEAFKLGFFLCNDHGFQKALDFSKLDCGPSYDWIEVRSKKKPSYA